MTTLKDVLKDATESKSDTRLKVMDKRSIAESRNIPIKIYNSDEVHSIFYKLGWEKSNKKYLGKQTIEYSLTNKQLFEIVECVKDCIDPYSISFFYYKPTKKLGVYYFSKAKNEDLIRIICQK